MKLVLSDKFIFFFHQQAVLQLLAESRGKFSSADFDYTRSFKKFPAG